MNKSIRTNERELAANIAQWFNEHIKKNKFPFTSATCETGIKVAQTTYFGDLIIWTNREQSDAYSYIELKPPFGASENINSFEQKAKKLRVKIAYTWDFQNLTAYEIKDGNLVKKDTESQSVLTKVDDWTRGDIQSDIKAYIHKICEELLSISETGRFRKFQPDKHYFIKFIRNTVSSLIPVFEGFIREQNKNNKDKINKYVVEQGIAYPSDDDFYRLIASQRVYGLITKIIFYLTIKRYFSDLPDLLVENEQDLNRTLSVAFAKAREIDWQAVFESGPIAELGVPQECVPKLQEFFSTLKIYNLGQLPEDVIGELFEEIIDPEQRHNLGQFFTNEDLVDLIIGTVVNDPDRYYADPTCGSGTFLIRLYSRLKYLKQSLIHENILEKIWGMDVGKFPAELSTINLFRQNPSNYKNFPRVLNKDTFQIRKGDVFEFPPTSGGKNYVKASVKLPEFYGLVGNFPFIRQELIEKKVKGLKKRLVGLLAEEYLLDYPDMFLFKRSMEGEIELLKKYDEKKRSKTIKGFIEKKFLDLKLSGQADIYSYLFIHCGKLLSSDGSFAIITSNSWLDVAYGSILKKFFLDHFKIKMIVASWAEPWFEDAAVNTVFTVLEKMGDEKERDENLVRFVKLKRKLSELIPERDLQLEARQRWETVDKIVRTIETAELGTDTTTVTDSISSYEDDNLRVRMIKQKELKKELREKEDLSKWGKYLRAPDVYFEILEKCKDKLVPLKDVADVRRGITTGINDFFYLQKQIDESGKTRYKNARGWTGEIEGEYLKEVIKSPKESDTIEIDPQKLKNLIFICNKSKEELKKQGHFGALKYIEWGEKQRTKDNRKWPKVPSVKGRRYWWGISKLKPSNSILSCGIRGSYKIFENQAGVFADKRLYDIYSESSVINPILNSFMFHIYSESDTRQLGDGFIDLTVYEVSEIPVLKEHLLNKKILNAFKKIQKRKIEKVLDEYKKKNRIELDKTVLEALGLDPEEYLPRIYDGISQMVKERLELPKMRKKQKKQVVKVSYDQVKKSVIEECIGSGLKRFPDNFCTIEEVGRDYDDLDLGSYNTSGEPLEFEYFMGQYQISDRSGQEIFTTKHGSIAKFAIILAKPNVFQLQIPKDEKIAEIILKNYANYIEQLKEQIKLNAEQKLHNWSEAEKMTEEILREYGLGD